MNEILLLEKRILVDESPVVLSYSPDENWEKYFENMCGNWYEKDGYLIGSEPENKGGILLTRESYPYDVMLSFTVKSVLPATRDLNAVFAVEWDHDANYLKRAYISGVNGWYDGKSGIERFPEDELRVLTPSYAYTPGEEIRITTGSVEGHAFLMVNGELIIEMVDNRDSIKGGRVGFSPYSTVLAIKDIEIRKISWQRREQSYIPEF
ncbi:MAG: hypothetical protein IKC32_05550 [Clostridia bacterium]|nr:hypothetical protein [Clostridia bacterium]